jgi:hypothetical protein
MFGHQDEKTQAAPTDTVNPSAPADDTSAPGEPSLTPLLEEAADDGLGMNMDLPAATAAPAVAATAPAPVAPAAAPTVEGSDDLLDIKQQALQQLSPLVGHLDQSPEEKFRTTMMMIQAADNQDLLKTAYDAAQSITDEKARAQALLDIVNEINYFTQHPA